MVPNAADNLGVLPSPSPQEAEDARRRPPSAARLASILTRIAVHVVIAVGLAYLLALLLSRSLAFAVVAVLAFVLVCWSALLALRAPSPRAALAVVLSLAAVAVAVAFLAAALRSDASLAGDLAAEALHADPVGDCGGCPPGEDIRALGIGSRAGGFDVNVRLDRAPAAGAGLWLWFASGPPDPVLLERTRAGWRAHVPRAAPVALEDIAVGTDGALVVVSVSSERVVEPLAVVTSGGDRAPQTGFATAAAGTTAVRGAAGAVAGRVERDVAAAQAGYPALEKRHRALVRSLLGRQLTGGSYEYDLRVREPGRPALRAELAVRYPELSQTIVTTGGEPLQSLFVLRDGVSACTHSAGMPPRCGSRPPMIALPSSQAAALVRAPSAVAVRELPARSVLGETARCLAVVRSTAEGPAEGESCWLADGALAYQDNERTGQLLVLVDRSPSAADARFRLPEGS